MSKFVTPFPFPLEELKELLPEGAYFDRVIWNKDINQLELHWEHDPFFTGLDHPVEFRPEALKKGSLPKEVKSNAEDDDANSNLGCSDPFDHPLGCLCSRLDQKPAEELEAIRIARHFAPLIQIPHDPIAVAQKPAEPGETVGAGDSPVSGHVRTVESEKVSSKALRRKGRAN